MAARSSTFGRQSEQIRSARSVTLGDTCGIVTDIDPDIARGADADPGAVSLIEPWRAGDMRGRHKPSGRPAHATVELLIAKHSARRPAEIHRTEASR
ncbi:hypothetical protein ACU4GR_30990 [Methylobacterium oryzae CBMB20]|uniref:hypothetical protein n=1 Tax=Methylobacterium oryzae TaxID=334852 RepID=UPI002F357E13